MDEEKLNTLPGDGDKQSVYSDFDGCHTVPVRRESVTQIYKQMYNHMRLKPSVLFYKRWFSTVVLNTRGGNFTLLVRLNFTQTGAINHSTTRVQQSNTIEHRAPQPVDKSNTAQGLFVTLHQPPGGAVVSGSNRL